MSTKKTTEPGVTVKDLIKMLRKLPPEAPVSLEGCDCIGAWNGKIDGDKDGVLLCR